MNYIVQEKRDVTENNNQVLVLSKSNKGFGKSLRYVLCDPDIVEDVQEGDDVAGRVRGLKEVERQFEATDEDSGETITRNIVWLEP